MEPESNRAKFVRLRDAFLDLPFRSKINIIDNLDLIDDLWADGNASMGAIFSKIWREVEDGGPELIQELDEQVALQTDHVVSLQCRLGHDNQSIR